MFANHFHQAGTLPGTMLGNAGDHVVGVAEVMPRMTERALKVN